MLQGVVLDPGYNSKQAHDPKRHRELAEWVEQHRPHWETRLDRVENYLAAARASRSHARRSPQREIMSTTTDREIV